MQPQQLLCNQPPCVSYQAEPSQPLQFRGVQPRFRLVQISLGTAGCSIPSSWKSVLIGPSFEAFSLSAPIAQTESEIGTKLCLDLHRGL